MNELDAEFKTKFMDLVNTQKEEAGKTSSLMRIEKRERIIRCMQNPELEPNVKFRSRVKEKKYRLIQDGNEVFLGVPDETSGDIVYRRAACVEEFWDIINTAHVENGHIGVVHTFNAIRSMYALLPRYLVSRYVRMCPVCAHTFKNPHLNRVKNYLADAKISSDAVTNIAQPDTGEAAQTSTVSLTAVLTGQQADGDQMESSDQLHNAAVVETSSDSASEPAMKALGEDIRMVFTCHICDMSFEKKLFYQRHIRAHKEHNPSIPYVAPYKFPASPKGVKHERRSYTAVSRGRMVIVDGDMGGEACQALMLAACRSDLQLLAVTCVCGSVNMENACNNALRVLNVCQRHDVKVYCGAERPLISKVKYGAQNLPGASWQSPVDATLIKSEHAVSAMIRLVNEEPGKITLVCLGPLTNLALALRLDPLMAKKLKEVFILGGNVEGRGDGSVCAEQNFHYDPESAYTVLEDVPSVTLLPYEVCHHHKLTGEFFDSWVHLGTDKSEFVRGMGDDSWLRDCQRNGYAPYSAYAMAAVADRTIALEKKSVYATVELSGSFSRGMMVVDWMQKLGKQPNVEFVKSLDLGKIESLLVGTVEEPEAMEVYTL